MRKSTPAMLLLFLAAGCSAFDVKTLPENPTAGDGFLLSVSGKGAEGCRALYDGAEYPLYGGQDGAYSIFLPTNIEDGGRKAIMIEAAGGRRKKLKIDVARRVVQAVVLSAGSEKMRDAQPMIDTQDGEIRAALKTATPARLWSGGFVEPAKGEIVTQFAVHRQGKAYSYYHRGLDISAPLGTPVSAAAAGKVILCRRGLNAYGNTIMIDHGQGIVTCYFHMKKLLVKEGEEVRKGAKIGKVGSTGWASGPHLHYGVYLQGKPVDPAWWEKFSASAGN